MEHTGKIGVRDAEKFAVSPFIDQVVIKTSRKKITVARGTSLVDYKTGEIEGMTEIAQVIEVDKENFIKLFTRDLAIWFDLSKAGLRTFGCLLTVVQETAINSDLVFFDYKSEIVKKFKISKATFYRGVDELLTKKFVARHKSAGWYFINTNIFFNGNRARFVKEYYCKNQIPSPDDQKQIAKYHGLLEEKTTKNET